MWNKQVKLLVDWKKMQQSHKLWSFVFVHLKIQELWEFCFYFFQKTNLKLTSYNKKNLQSWLNMEIILGKTDFCLRWLLTQKGIP